MSGMRWDRGWCATAGSSGVLHLSAGADRQFAIDGLDTATVDWVLGFGGARADVVGGEVVPASGEQRAVLDRLVDIGAVVPVVTDACVSFVHDPAAAPVATALAARLAEHGIEVADGEPAVVLRTGDAWPSPPTNPHLGVDLTLHHTVLIGPFVLPGVTACLHCLQARTDHLWTRTPIPPSPRVARSVAAVADLIAIQIELAAAGRSPLVNATIAWDLERGVSDRQRVFKLTGCSACGPPPEVGRVHLPWATGARP